MLKLTHFRRKVRFGSCCHTQVRLTPPRKRRKYPELVKIVENLVGCARIDWLWWLLCRQNFRSWVFSSTILFQKCAVISDCFFALFTPTFLRKLWHSQWSKLALARWHDTHINRWASAKCMHLIKYIRIRANEKNSLFLWLHSYYPACSVKGKSGEQSAKQLFAFYTPNQNNWKQTVKAKTAFLVMSQLCLCQVKTCLRGFRPSKTQTSLHSHRS